MVTDQQHPATRANGAGDDGFEVADAGHRRLIDHQQRASVRPVKPTGP